MYENVHIGDLIIDALTCEPWWIVVNIKPLTPIARVEVTLWCLGSNSLIKEIYEVDDKKCVWIFPGGPKFPGNNNKTVRL